MSAELLNLFERYSILNECRDAIEEAYRILEECFCMGNRLYLCGNGGSAADCEHIAGELLKCFKLSRRIDNSFRSEYVRMFGEEPSTCLTGALPAFSLVSQTSYATAFINDEDSDDIFAQQVYAYGSKGDVLLAISTSGNSANIVRAAKVALAKGMNVLGLTGRFESALSALCTVCIRVPEAETYRVQELHLPVYHALCAALEERFFGDGR